MVYDPRMSAIEVRNLSKQYRVYQKREGLWASLKGLFSREYKTVDAVRDVSFTIEAGEMVAFLGPNGAGKTTTLKLLSGLIFPSSGTATALGYVPWERHYDYRRRFVRRRELCQTIAGNKCETLVITNHDESSQFRVRKGVVRFNFQGLGK